MTKFNQIMKTIGDGVSFSWSLNGFGAPMPKNMPQATCDQEDEHIIGYHTQIYLARSIYFEDLSITYQHEDGKIKIYY